MKIVFIGAGNVASHLGQALWESGQNIVQVYNRTGNKAELLATNWKAASTDEFDKIDLTAELYIICVSDNAIGLVAKKLSEILGRNKLVVHTSGASSIDILDPYFNNYGLFYPLQTFSPRKKPNFKAIPFCIEANSSKNTKILQQLATTLSQDVFQINESQRLALHVAAVFINNFVNYMLHISYNITSEEKIPFKLLLPLLTETIETSSGKPPINQQSGPAKRGDTSTIKKHLSYLEKMPEYRHLYGMISESILQHFNKKNKI